MSELGVCKIYSLKKLSKSMLRGAKFKESIKQVNCNCKKPMFIVENLVVSATSR